MHASGGVLGHGLGCEELGTGRCIAATSAHVRLIKDPTFLLRLALLYCEFSCPGSSGIKSHPPAVLLGLAARFPNGVVEFFRLSRVHFFDEGVHDDEDDETFDLEVAVFPDDRRLPYETELLLDEYCEKLLGAVSDFLKDKKPPSPAKP